VFFIKYKKKNIFLETKPIFSLTGKYFLLTNFSNDKQTHESLESDFKKNNFLPNKQGLNLSYEI
jgi:hypothetical protein